MPVEGRVLVEAEAGPPAELARDSGEGSWGDATSLSVLTSKTLEKSFSKLPILLPCEPSATLDELDLGSEDGELMANDENPAIC